MEITKPQRITKELAAQINPRSFGYRIPGIQTWGILLIFFGLIIVAPRTALVMAQVVSIYLLLRFTLVAYFYLVSLALISTTRRKFKNGTVLNRLTQEQKARFSKIHHVIFIPNYKEPIEVMSRSLQALVDQKIDHKQITVVLPMEEAEPGARAKAQQLSDKFASSFAHFIVTYHPTNLPGEIAGKAANQTWAARQIKRELLDRYGLKLENMTATSCDADSVLDPDYFNMLTYEYVTLDDPEKYMWQSPIFFDQNIWQTPGSVRLLTFFNNAVQIAELSNPFSMAFPLSTYSMSYKLLVEVDYWDPMVISDDWHMFLRCFFYKEGTMHLRPIFLPTTGEPFLGATVFKTWMMVYNTRIRHAWGAADEVYVLQQWPRHPRIPFLTTLGRFTKVWHDNMIFSLGSVFSVVGTLLSIWLDRNPVITYPAFPVPYVLEVLNFLGAAGLIVIWLVERVRCNNKKYSWRFRVLVEEIASWAIFPFITFALSGIPALHAHTKMLFGGTLTFERTPKGVLPMVKE
jgi:hypothetical protein